jgi:hypothetical protein
MIRHLLKAQNVGFCMNNFVKYNCKTLTIYKFYNFINTNQQKSFMQIFIKEILNFMKLLLMSQ